MYCFFYYLVPPALILPINFKLDPDSEYAIISFGPSIQYYENFSDVFGKLSLYSKDLTIGTTT